MAFVSDQDRTRIQNTVAEVEATTRGEFVVVLAQQADEYLFIPVLWAALLALAVPGLVHFSGLAWAGDYTYPIQISTFVLSALLFRWAPLKMRLIPKAIKHQRAQRLAQQQFLAQNLHHTEERTGVLLFIAQAEHYVEIIADRGINEKVPTGTWDQVVRDLVARIKADQVGDGIVGAIRTCGTHLEQHFPHRPDQPDRNELPDQLVEI